MDDYLPKPVSPDRLGAKIGTWLSEDRDGEDGIGVRAGITGSAPPRRRRLPGAVAADDVGVWRGCRRRCAPHRCRAGRAASAPG